MYLIGIDDARSGGRDYSGLPSAQAPTVLRRGLSASIDASRCVRPLWASNTASIGKSYQRLRGR
jgi:hypothetical protein